MDTNICDKPLGRPHVFKSEGESTITKKHAQVLQELRDLNVWKADQDGATLNYQPHDAKRLLLSSKMESTIQTMHSQALFDMKSCHLHETYKESAKSVNPTNSLLKHRAANLASPRLPVAQRFRLLIDPCCLIIKQASTDGTKLVPNQDWHRPQKAWRYRLRISEINKVPYPAMNERTVWEIKCAIFLQSLKGGELTKQTKKRKLKHTNKCGWWSKGTSFTSFILKNYLDDKIYTW